MKYLIFKKRNLTVITFLSLIFLLSLTTIGATIEVAKDGAQFSSIQAAIDSATPGDTIIVQEGTYEENLTVNKDLALKASSTSKVKITGSKEGYPLLKVGPSKVSVTIKGLTLTDAAGSRCKDSDRGLCPNAISTVGKPELTVKKTAVKGSIYLRDSATAKITASKVVGDSWSGVWVGNSAEVTLNESTITNNSNGLWVGNSAKAMVKNSKFVKNEYGIKVKDSAQATIVENEFRENEYGIWLGGLSWTVLEYNKITENKEAGIQLRGTAGAKVNENTIQKNGIGIEIYALETLTVNLKGTNNKIAENEKNFDNVPQRLQNKLVSD